MEAGLAASMLFLIFRGQVPMAESTASPDTAEQVARGNLLYEEQQRKSRHFRIQVLRPGLCS